MPARTGRLPSRHLGIGPVLVGKAAQRCRTLRRVGCCCMRRAVIRAKILHMPRSAAGRRPSMASLTSHGTLVHGSENGDGVRGRMVSSSRGIFGEWSCGNGEAGTVVEGTVVEAGDTVDFITDCVENVIVRFVHVARTIGVHARRGRGDDFRLARRLSRPGERSRRRRDCQCRAGLAIGVFAAAYPRRVAVGLSHFSRSRVEYLRMHPQHTAAGRSPESQALGEPVPGPIELERVSVCRLSMRRTVGATSGEPRRCERCERNNGQ